MPTGVAPPDRPHLASLVEDFRRHGDQTAIVSRTGLRQHRTSYRDLAGIAERFAAELHARGIAKGDRVLIWGDNGAAWVGALFGCILRGVIAVPIDVAGSPDFAHRVAHEVAPKLVTGSHAQLRLLDTAAPHLAFEDFASALPSAAARSAIDGPVESDAVQIVFTSGTTGEPKGVVHTHGNILASLRPIEREMRKYLKYERIFHPLRFLHTLPLSHVFGQFMGIWIPALLAAEVHFESQLIPGDLVSRMQRERISVLAAVPRVLDVLQTYLTGRFAGLAARLDRAQGMPAWRRWWLFRDVHRALGFKFWALICGGATLPARIEHFWNTLGLVVIQGYGSTETSALVSLNHPFHAAAGSIGKILPGREIRLGADGEILVRGATVSNATWERGVLRSRDPGWLATGDLASVDAAGNLQFRGRKKEVIVTASGWNIYPDDLEAALLRQPQIKAAAVVEASGPRGSEALAALVVSNAAEAAAAVRAANAELAEYQQIRRWVVWHDPDLPRTSTGKVLRRQVAAALRGLRPEAAPAAGLVEDLIGRVTGGSARLPDSALLSEDLQLDSLGRVELQSLLEDRLGLEIDEAAYQRARTLGELKALLGGSSGTAAMSEAGPAPPPRTRFVYPRWPWTRLPRALRVIFLEIIVRPLVAVLARPRVCRHLNGVPSGPLLLVANHVSAYDVPLILYALPWHMRRRVAVAMAGEMLDAWRHARNQANLWLNLIAPVQYWLVTALFNVFPLPQYGNFRQSFAHAGRAMDAGFHVLVFPEGRRTPDGALHPFQAGAGMLWRELRTPALPVYLEGLDAWKAGHRPWFRSDGLAIHIGAPIPFDADREAAAAARILEQAVRELGERRSSSAPR